MLKNIIAISLVAVGVLSVVGLFASPRAEADHKRDEWRVFDRLQNCTIYSKPIGGGHDIYAANCSIAID
jgi:hypothetical protein